MQIKMMAALAAALVLGACVNDPQSSAGTNGGSETLPQTDGTAPSGLDTGGVDQSGLNSTGDNPFALFIEGTERVYFAFDSSELTVEARGFLDQVGAYLQASPRARLFVEGHCDDRGTREYNLALGDRRANAIRDYLAALGVAGQRVETISYGKERPEVIGTGEAVWAKNRRGVLVLG